MGSSTPRARATSGESAPQATTSSLSLERERVGSLAHVDAQRGCAPHELTRHTGRVGDPILSADRRAEHVVDPQAVDEGRVDALDGHAESSLHRSPLLELGEPGRRRREEEVADLLEERRAELLEEPDARLGEPHLGLGRELLAHAAHRLAGGAARDLPHVGEHDVVGAAEGEVVGDRGADRARAGYDDAGHPRSSSRSPSVSWRSGRRTSSRTGTPRNPSRNFRAACRGKRSTAARSSPSADCPSGRRLAHDRRHPVRERRGEAGDGPGGARLQARRRSAPRGRRRRRALRSDTARSGRTARRRPSDRRGSAPARATPRSRRAERRSRSRARTRRRRTAAARTRLRLRRNARAGRNSSSWKYGGPITATASAPASAACAASATVSAVVWAPQCAATCRRPAEAVTKDSTARRRSSTPKRIPSPVVPSASRPSSPAAARNSTYGGTASSSRRSPASGVTAAARAPRSMCRLYWPYGSSTLVSLSYGESFRAVSNPGPPSRMSGPPSRESR